MINVHIVGCGSLGSTFATEVAKKATALDFPLQVLLYDFDKVEERNVVAQDFNPGHIDMYKAEVMASALYHYPMITPKAIVKKVTEENYAKEMMLDDQSIIIDAVDNVPTRHLLWKIGIMHNVPVLHMGMSQNGSGLVSWNFKGSDTFNLSPANLSPKQLKELGERDEDKSLAPCILNSFRGLILNTSLAGCISMFLFLGKDQSNFLHDLHEGKPFPGVLTSWHTTTTSMELAKELTKMEER